MISSFTQDLRYALRQLRKNPGFAAVAVLTLALGSGATTLIFTVVSGVLLKPLQYSHPESLVALHVRAENHGDTWGFSYPDFLDCRRECRSFEGVTAWTYGGGTVSAPGEPEYVDGRLISSDLFSVLRVPLVTGRSFVATDDQVGAAPVAIISTRLWQRRYGSNPKAVGMSLAYDGKAICGLKPGHHFRATLAAERTGPGRETYSLAAADCGEPCPADCLRQCREPLVNACHLARARVCVAAGFRRARWTPLTPVFDRKQRARHLWRFTRALAGNPRHGSVLTFLA